MQNELVDAMSLVVTEGIKQEIGNFWYTFKVNGTKDQTGVENTSVIMRFFNEHSLKAAERLFVLSSTDSSDGKSIPDVALTELLKQHCLYQRYLVKSTMAHLSRISKFASLE